MEQRKHAIGIATAQVHKAERVDCARCLSRAWRPILGDVDAALAMERGLIELASLGAFSPEVPGANSILPTPSSEPTISARLM